MSGAQNSVAVLIAALISTDHHWLARQTADRATVLVRHAFAPPYCRWSAAALDTPTLADVAKGARQKIVKSTW